jgi:hypothetical protein
MRDVGVLTTVLHGNLNEDYGSALHSRETDQELTLDLALGELVSENALRADAGMSYQTK